MTAHLIRGDAARLPLADGTVDLVVKSPPYFGLRSYTDDGERVDGQVGAEPSAAAYLAALVAVTSECVRVLKPTGSIFVNLGDKYSDRAGPGWVGSSDHFTGRPPKPRRATSTDMAPRKSLLGLPWRYALSVIDDLGLRLRGEIVWDKPNAMPESVDDRVRRTHEQWFHFTLAEHYYSDLDTIREPYAPDTATRYRTGYRPTATEGARLTVGYSNADGGPTETNPLGRLPGSVWRIASEPLDVPAYLVSAGERVERWVKDDRDAWALFERDPSLASCAYPRDDTRRELRVAPDHHAAFPTEWPRRFVSAFCPPGGIVLDPFGGTGTTALVARALGRRAVSLDLSRDYCRLASWRLTDPGQIARALRVPVPPRPVQDDALFPREAFA